MPAPKPSLLFARMFGQNDAPIMHTLAFMVLLFAPLQSARYVAVLQDEASCDSAMPGPLELASATMTTQ